MAKMDYFHHFLIEGTPNRLWDGSKIFKKSTDLSNVFFFKIWLFSPELRFTQYHYGANISPNGIFLPTKQLLTLDHLFITTPIYGSPAAVGAGVTAAAARLHYTTSPPTHTVFPPYVS